MGMFLGGLVKWKKRTLLYSKMKTRQHRLYIWERCFEGGCGRISICSSHNMYVFITSGGLLALFLASYLKFKAVTSTAKTKPHRLHVRALVRRLRMKCNAYTTHNIHYVFLTLESCSHYFLLPIWSSVRLLRLTLRLLVSSHPPCCR